MAEVKVPPHSETAEKSVLGALMVDRDAVVAVAEFLRPEHFYNEKHQKIFESALALYQDREPVDVVSVGERLKKIRSLTEVGGTAYLGELVNNVPTAAHAEHYGRLVRDNFTKRQLISAAGKISQMAFDEGREVPEILDEAESSVFSLAQQHLKQVFVPVKDILAESFDRLEELMDRLLVAQAEIDAWKMKTGNMNEDEFAKLSDAMGELYETPLYIDDTPGMSILEMRTKARRLQVEH